MILNPERLIFCMEEGDTSYLVWSGQNRSIAEYSKRAGVHMIRGQYYSISQTDKAAVPTPVTTPPYPTRIVSSEQSDDGQLNIVLTARAPLFIGNQVAATGLYIGFNEFFGRVLIDSIVGVPIRSYACYECQLVLSTNEDYSTQWTVKEVVAKLSTVPNLCLLHLVFEELTDQGATCICSQRIGEDQQRQYFVPVCNVLEKCFGVDTLNNSYYGPRRGMPLTLVAIPTEEQVQEGICAATIDCEAQRRLEQVGEMVEPPANKQSVESAIQKLKEIQAWIADGDVRHRLQQKDPSLLQKVLNVLMGGNGINGNGG